MSDPKSWSWLQNNILEKGADIARSLRSGVDESTPVPNLEWNVGRLGAHIVSIPQMYIRAQQSHQPFPDIDKVEAFSAGTSAMVGTTDPTELADLIVPELQKAFDILGADGDAHAKFYEHDLTVRHAGGIVLSELLLHHVDLVGATSEPKSAASITNEHARAAFFGLFEASQYLVNGETARRCQGIIHLHLTGSDGGDHYTTTIDGDTAITTPGRPPKADFHTRADPATLLLASLGRTGQTMALLTGRIIGYGRNPILGFRSQNLFHDV